MQAMRGSFSRLHPAVRAGMTSASIMATGDVLCQKLQQRSLVGPVDWRRTGRFAVVGATVHGPFFMYGFKWLDTVIKGEQSFKTALMKTSLGQVTLFPVYLGSAFMLLKLMEGFGVKESYERVSKVFVPTYVAGSVFWPAANMFNFMFLPPSARLIYVNAAGLVWNAYLSLVNSKPSAADAPMHATKKAVKGR